MKRVPTREQKTSLKGRGLCSDFGAKLVSSGRSHARTFLLPGQWAHVAVKFVLIGVRVAARRRGQTQGRVDDGTRPRKLMFVRRGRLFLQGPKIKKSRNKPRRHEKTRTRLPYSRSVPTRRTTETGPSPAPRTHSETTRSTATRR